MLDFFAKLPWLVRVAFVGGGSMITGFSSKLPDALQEAGLLLGLALASLGVIAFIWHWLNERRIKRGRGKITLEPATLIPAFTVIALVGVVGVAASLGWQYWRNRSVSNPIVPSIAEPAQTKSDQPKPDHPLGAAVVALLEKRKVVGKPGPLPAAPNTYTMQDDVDGTGPYIADWHISLGGWPTVADGFTAEQLRKTQNTIPTPLQRPLNSYEIEQKQRAIAPIMDILTSMEPLVKKGEQLSTGWRNAIWDTKNHPTYMQDLIAYRDMLKERSDSLEKLRAKVLQYKDVNVATKITATEPTIQATSNFLVAYQYISSSFKENAPHEAFDFFMKKPEEDFKEAVARFAEWRTLSNSRLLGILGQM